MSAWRCASCGMRRLKACGFRSPRISASITSRSTANVVTLMPPAVPALPPPMNISTSVPSSVSGVRSPMATVLKPPLRGCTLWKKPANAFSPRLIDPSVRSFVHSRARNMTVPTASRIPDIEVTSFVCRLQRRGRRHSRRSSKSTGNPNPPATTSTQSVTLISGSSANCTRLSLKSTKPALLNADTEWKIPSQSERPSDSPLVTKCDASTAAPASSKTRLVRAMPKSTRRTSPIARLRVSAVVLNRIRMPRRRDTSRPSSVASAMMPKPPTWISARITTWPKPVQ